MKEEHRATFELQFPPSEIMKSAEAYLQSNDNAAKDERAFAAGQRIRGGDYSFENLKIIYDWKTEAFIYLGLRERQLLRNRTEEIEDALRLAVLARTERTAVAVLCGLRGVGLPLASAILTAIKPEQYTVFDIRALRSLGCIRSNGTIDFYLSYLLFCRGLAQDSKVDLRTLDRALFWNGGRRSAMRR